MKKVVVVGGAVLDVFAYPHDKFILNDSNPGYLKTSLGGVARNIAENLARLEIDTTLVTMLGKDEGKKQIMQNAQDVMLKLSSIPATKTPTYIAILNETNEMVAAVADMDEIELLSKEHIKKRNVIFKNADYIVLDTNLNLDTLQYIFKTYDKEFYIDVISCKKAEKIKPFYRYIHGLKLNILEAKHLSGLDTDCEEELAKYFLSQGVKEVYLTLGQKGSIYMTKEEIIKTPSHLVEIKNTAGAGDAFLAGIIYGKIHGLNIIDCAQKAAEITLQSNKAVNDCMCRKKIEENL